MLVRDLTTVNSIADIVWGDEFYESPEVFAQKFNYYPAGCWMYNNHAYIFSHSAVLDHPPKLNEVLPDSQCNCYHIHDIALLPSVRGLGIATKIIKQIIQENPYPYTTLVSVAGTLKFWESFGFTVRSQTAYGQYLCLNTIPALVPYDK
jgi:GNAT superfamily N-acetyltransferase